MKPWIWAVVLGFSGSAHAQSVAQAQQPGVVLPVPNDFDTLKKASEKLFTVVDDSPVLREGDTLEERQRALELNAPALRLMREALEQEFLSPPFRSLDDEPFNFFSSWQELGRQTINESKVKFAANDFVSAGDAAADAMELGVAVARGVPTMALFMGQMIESDGRKQLEAVAPKLDAARCRALAARLDAIEARRFPFVDALRQEKQMLLNEQTSANAARKPDGPTLTQELSMPQSRALLKHYFGYSDEEVEQLARSSFEAMLEGMARGFDEGIERAKSPFSHAPFELQPQLNDPWWRMSQKSTKLFYPRDSHFEFERNRTAHRLLQSALLLRAHKLETGTYPAKFAAPIDPFSPTRAPLVYQRDGAIYELYSVGPDGRDNSGSEIQTGRTHRESGLKTVSEDLTLESFGDIAAPIF